MYNKNIILLGAPGPGKGTISKLLKDKFGFNVITTGDILRAEKKSGSEIGQKINNLIGKGNLVPDELINEIVQKEIKNIEQPFILDGFPRTVPQAKFLDEIAKIGLVIYIEVSDETITQRILERGKTSNREDDQSVRIIERRLKQFKEETFPLIHFYKEKKILTYVDGERTIQEVFEQVQNILKLWS